MKKKNIIFIFLVFLTLGAFAQQNASPAGITPEQQNAYNQQMEKVRIHDQQVSEQSKAATQKAQVKRQERARAKQAKLANANTPAQPKQEARPQPLGANTAPKVTAAPGTVLDKPSAQPAVKKQ